jgi:hypothetical protein
VVLGHDGRFGRLLRLSGVQKRGGPVYGDVVSRSGNVTLGWGDCRLGLSECTVFTSRGNANGRFGATYKLATSSQRSYASAAIGPGTVALQRCPHPGSKCTIALGYAAPGYRFTRSRRLTSDGRIAQLASDSAGDEVIVWSTSGGSLWAAVRMVGQSRRSRRTCRRCSASTGKPWSPGLRRAIRSAPRATHEVEFHTVG